MLRMGSAVLISVEEYLTTAYRPDCEYVDGVVKERNVGEKEHSKVQRRLSTYLDNRSGRLGIQVFPEQRVQVRATRFRVPDLCVVVGPEPDEEIFTRPPFLCIEILSKDDRMSEMQERIDDYLSFGVPYVWLLNPKTKRAQVYTAEGMREAKQGVLRTENPEIAVPLAEIFGA
jgi:Uma2 family endonuclease